MSAWNDGKTDARKAKAKKLYLKLKLVGWNNLSPNDRVVMNLLGWFCLEEDDGGEPEQFIDHFEETYAKTS